MTVDLHFTAASGDGDDAPNMREFADKFVLFPSLALNPFDDSGRGGDSGSHYLQILKGCTIHLHGSFLKRLEACLVL